MKQKLSTSKLVSTSCLLAAFAGAHATSILSPTSVLVNTAGDFGASYDIGNTIDQSGLSTGFTSGVTDFDAYLASGPTHTFIASDFEWFAPDGMTSGFIIYDLGAEYMVDRIALWNEEFSGLSEIAFSSGSLADLSDSVTGGVFNPADSVFDADYRAQVFALSGGPRVARYLGLEVTGPNSPFLLETVSMGEFAVSVAPVPEPGTMAALGLGLAAIARRRKQK